MGLNVREFTRQHIVAIAIGVLVAGTPLIAFNFWLSGVIDRQEQAATESEAGQALALAESRVTQVISALDDLATRADASCEAGSAAAMQRTTFVTMPIKEISILSPAGQTLCTHLGSPHSAGAALLNGEIGKRTVMSSEALPGSNIYSVDILRLANATRMVRLRRPAGAGRNEIAAMVPASLFLPEAGKAESPQYDTVLKTAAGASIAEAGKRPDDPLADPFVSTLRSSKFGFSVEVIGPRGRMVAGIVDLKWVGLIATGAALLLLAGLGVMIPARSPHNPISELKHALAAGEFVPFYQPIVDIRSGQLRGAEVLVRWRKPDGSLVLPGSFIPLAESGGLIRAMTFDLMHRVCAEVGKAIGSRPALKISFNFAGMLFSDETIVKDVRRTFSQTPIKLSQVVLEVTERDPIENFTLTRQVIAALQGLGVRIAIDDVGTGHSGLSYMLKLGVDIIKIDKMFVDAIGTDRNSTTIVETLVDLAHNMRMDIVAEGVENFEQVMHLRELGIRSAQGYVFAPPLPGSAFLQLIEAMDSLNVEIDDMPRSAIEAVAA